MVVDRDSRRYTKDKYVKKSGFQVDREKIDIADFDLVKYASLQMTDEQCAPSKVIGIAKHLCGGATDLALNSY